MRKRTFGINPVTLKDKERMKRVIHTDAYVIGLIQAADPALALIVGCKVGDPVGCAIHSLALDLGVTIRRTRDPNNPPTTRYDGGSNKFSYSRNPYEAVRKGYGLTEEQMESIFAANDRHFVHQTRLEALDNLVDSWPTKEA